MRSIRWSFLLWTSGVVAVVVVGFGAATWIVSRRWSLARVDGDLLEAHTALSDRLRGGAASGVGGPPWSRPLRSRELLAALRSLGDASFGDEDRWNELLGGGGASRLDRAPPWAQRGAATRRGPPPWVADTTDAPGSSPSSPEPRVRDPEPGPDSYIAIWDAEHRLLRSSAPAVELPAPPASPVSEAIHRTRGSFRELIAPGPRGTTIVLGVSIARELDGLERLGASLVVVGALALLVGLAGSWLLARRVTAPIDGMVTAAESVSLSSLDQRLETSSMPSELERLARVLNEAFDRIESEVSKQIRFVADASHELRTPVAILLAETESIRRRERTLEDYRGTVEVCHAAAQRMRSLVDGLLTLSRLDAARPGTSGTRVDLRHAVEESSSWVAALAATRHVTVTSDLERATILAQPEQVGQVLVNLLSNAILYNHEGGNVRVTVRRRPDSAELVVEDDGVGIPPEHLAHVFDRFYRVDPARSRRVGGSGLGLSIVQAIVTAQGGTVEVRSVPERGSRFVVRWPRERDDGSDELQSVEDRSVDSRQEPDSRPPIGFNSP